MAGYFALTPLFRHLILVGSLSLLLACVGGFALACGMYKTILSSVYMHVVPCGQLHLLLVPRKINFRAWFLKIKSQLLFKDFLRLLGFLSISRCMANLVHKNVLFFTLFLQLLLY